MILLLKLLFAVISLAIFASCILTENIDDGCFHRGETDSDGIWICRKCDRRWYYSYLGGGGWVSIQTQKMEDYLRGKG